MVQQSCTVCEQKPAIAKHKLTGHSFCKECLALYLLNTPFTADVLDNADEPTEN